LREKLIIILIKAGGNGFVIMLRKGFGIVATALYKQEQPNEEYDCSKHSANAETNILTYGVELPNNTPNFFVESHTIIILFVFYNNENLKEFRGEINTYK
jgi:hypothetical protein